MNPDPIDYMPYDDDDYGGSIDEQEQNISATQQSTMTNFGLDLVSLKAGVQVQKLAFSRIAKRVDVHKLKQAIWEEIDPPTPTTKSPAKFSDLVRSLDKTTYPRENLKDVSVPYCFICLLHLANEHGLTIQQDETSTDLIVVKH